MDVWRSSVLPASLLSGKAFVAAHHPQFSPLLLDLSSTLLLFSPLPLAACSYMVPHHMVEAVAA